MKTWSLVLQEGDKPFGDGDQLLRHVEKQLYKILSESNLAKMHAWDPEGKYFDLEIQLKLKERD